MRKNENYHYVLAECDGKQFVVDGFESILEMPQQRFRRRTERGERAQGTFGKVLSTPLPLKPHISTIVHRLSTAPLWPAHIAFIESGRLISERQEYTRAHTHRIRKRNTDSRNAMHLHRITAARWMSDVAGPHIAIATLVHLNPSISAASSFALIDSHVLALAH